MPCQSKSITFRTPCRIACKDTSGEILSFLKKPFEEEHYNKYHAEVAERFLYSCLSVPECECDNVFLTWNAFYCHVSKAHPLFIDLVKGSSRLDQLEHREKYRITLNDNNAAKEVFSDLLAGKRNSKNMDEMVRVAQSSSGTRLGLFRGCIRTYLLQDINELAAKLDSRVATQHLTRPTKPP